MKNGQMLIKQDINFLDKPLWFQDMRPSGKSFIWTDIEGYTYQTGYSPPDKVDALILLYLLMKSQKQEYGNKMRVSRYEIVKECGFPLNQKYYDRIKESLKRWKNV